MIVMRSASPCFPVAVTIVLAACSGRDPGEAAAPVAAAPAQNVGGAAGTVGVDDAGAAENPQTPALSGGMAGQTPDWGKPGGAPSVVQTAPDAAGASVSTDTPHAGR